MKIFKKTCPQTKPCANTALSFYSLSLTCLPLLWYQGKQVRRHTLRLPPPEGARRSSVGTGQPFRLLVLGDSAAEGVGVSSQENALLGQLVSQLALTGCVEYQLIARTGDTAADCYRHLSQQLHDGNCMTAVDAVVVSLGVNDVTAMTSVSAWKKQLLRMTQVLRKHIHAKQIIFTAVPPMQHFSALPVPLNHWLGLRASMLNQALQQHCKQQPNHRFLTLDFPFNSNYLAEDGFHPSKDAYALWADSVMNSLR